MTALININSIDGKEPEKSAAMQPDSSYYKSKNSEQVELTVSRAPGRGRKALCLSNFTQGKAIVILYVLLGICIAVATALFVVIMGKLSQCLAEAQLDRDMIKRDAKRNLSYHQDYLEITNLTHSMSKLLAESKRDHDRLQEVLSRAQEELRNITEFICTKCPPGWQHFEKKCYFFSTLRKSWLDAKQFCTNEGSHLVIVNSKQEQTFLSNHVTEPDVYWLGLSDSEKEGEWRWLDGSPLSVRFWGAGEPNNAGQDGENCGNLRFDGKWNDAVCSLNEHWICERQC